MSTTHWLLLSTSALESESSRNCVAIYNMFVPEGLQFFYTLLLSTYILPSEIILSMIFGHEILLVCDDIITPSDTISNNKFGVLQERLSYMYSKIFH